MSHWSPNAMHWRQDSLTIDRVFLDWNGTHLATVWRYTPTGAWRYQLGHCHTQHGLAHGQGVGYVTRQAAQSGAVEHLMHLLRWCDEDQEGENNE
jgi:hypothetical protein